MRSLEIRVHLILTDTAKKMKFSIKNFSSKCDQIHSFLRISSPLVKENYNFCAVWLNNDII